MSAFKKLNQQDVFITFYTAKKSWSIKSDDFNSYGIEVRSLTSGSPFISGAANYTKHIYYNSLKHLYYSNFSGSLITGSYENFIPSSLESGSRDLGQDPYLITLPKHVFGNRIEPGSLTITFYSAGLGTGVPDEVITLTDNKEGKLILTGSSLGSGVIGDIIYPHGVIVITENGTIATEMFDVATGYTASWDSNVDILTGNYNCKVRDYELNFTNNPSATISGSDGLFQDNITGSDFRPYVTAVGLYNDASELIAVGKLGQPIPKMSETDMTFILKLDY